jgi:hypothetical protein
MIWGMKNKISDESTQNPLQFTIKRRQRKWREFEKKSCLVSRNSQSEIGAIGANRCASPGLGSFGWPGPAAANQPPMEGENEFFNSIASFHKTITCLHHLSPCLRNCIVHNFVLAAKVESGHGQRMCIPVLLCLLHLLASKASNSSSLRVLAQQLLQQLGLGCGGWLWVVAVAAAAAASSGGLALLLLLGLIDQLLQLQLENGMLQLGVGRQQRWWGRVGGSRRNVGVLLLLKRK